MVMLQFIILFCN